MTLAYRFLFPSMALCWLVYWWISSYDVKAIAQRQSPLSRASHIVPLIVATLLLWLPRMPLALLSERFLPATEWSFWIGAGLAAAGFLFTVWARRHLGRNWSATVTIKEGHELITSGPYAIVRHPIYSGLLFAFIGAAVARGELRGLLAVAIALWAFWRKFRFEEQWMRQQFGRAYQDYAQQVAALVPFIL